MHRAFLLSMGLVLAGCSPADSPAPLVIAPSQGAMSGYYDVRVETALDVVEVRLGGIRGFDLRAEDGAVVFTVQGHPAPGSVALELSSSSEIEVYSDAFEYLPAEPGFERLVAMGASLSQGVQGGVPTQHGQRHSPSRFIAEQSGAFHPAPLLIPDLFPAIRGSDISPSPECEQPNIVDHLTEAAIDVLAKLNDEENNRISFYLGLVDPELEPYNVAVGNSGVPTMVHGPNPDSFAEGFLARFVFDPYVDIIADVEGSELELVEGLEPTVVVCADTYGNDLLGWKPVDEIRPDLEEFAERLSATGAEVFLSNIPRPTLLPGSGANEARDQLALEYKLALDDVAAEHPNVHVVDLYSSVDALLENGLQVGDRVLSVASYGGLISTDGLHLTDVGYAYQANLFIDQINEVMGANLEPVDLAAVYETDEHRPEALLEQGIDPACLP